MWSASKCRFRKMVRIAKLSCQRFPTDRIFRLGKPKGCELPFRLLSIGVSWRPSLRRSDSDLATSVYAKTSHSTRLDPSIAAAAIADGQPVANAFQSPMCNPGIGDVSNVFLGTEVDVFVEALFNDAGASQICRCCSLVRYAERIFRTDSRYQKRHVSAPRW